ncbi:DHA1 family bicyclomycin/chloramphenicol resistance-like MFS transporter [Mycolicibacterium sp. BK556]|uniref:multidrug effflux MFS transporter n=1 Tax=unclassified Mycolicibacterium TaxID=2636767 RepID=UPI00160EC1B0|nr:MULTISPECIES: multidrug effflux MFS transporter [unclassified Mycolicibacterium]MBB3603221.1 DHA1 family bicyclomycin/chloramphenicol resistance-like MFS transporter [Mycolicibacterium sp. BK556]MBB3633416.1 DHA1 family bicyclomycin/chloramphenicol resistance-like MFS transporter [Mycolicibacterium sp. BK607]
MTTVVQPTEAPQYREAAISPWLLVVLALLSAVAPVATDLYLPAFPEMTAELQGSATAVQLTLTAFLLGLTFGQLTFGPLSDRFGRRRPLLVGALLCVVASVVAATAPNIGILIAARFAQGFTGAAGMVIGRAVIADLTGGKTAGRAFSLMMIVGGVAPVIAPFAGGLLVEPLGWRGILWVVCAIAVAMLVSIVVVVRESHPVERRDQLKADAAQGISPWSALRSRTYLANTLAFGFGFSVMMAYISASPFVYQVMVGLTPMQYGTAFGVNALGMITVSAVSSRLTQTISSARLLGVGLVVTVAATLTLLTLVLTGAPVWLITIPIFVAVACQGLILGNATALALSAVPRAAGSGSAGLGALQFGLGAAVSPLVGLGGEHTALPLAVVMVAVSVLALTAYLVGRRVS